MHRKSFPMHQASAVAVEDGNMNSAVSEFIGLLTLIIGVAIIAVLVSKKAQTSQVLQAFFSGMGNLLQVVVSPITSGGNSFGQ